MRVRIALGVVSAAAVGWFAVLLVDVHRVDRAAAQGGTLAAVRAALQGPRPQFDRRIDDLRRAHFLNPDTTIDLDIAGAYEVRGGAANLAAAQRTVQSVLRDEPQNLDAWVELVRIARARGESALEDDAVAHAGRLDPLDFRRS